MCEQTLQRNRETLLTMTDIQREDCVTIEQAWEQLGISKQTIYNYMNYLNIRRHRFPYDRQSYITLADVERIRQFKQAKGS